MVKEKRRDYEMMRVWAEALYDHQDVRMRSLNRMRNLIRRKLLDLNFEPEKKKESKDVSDGKEWNDKDLFSLLELAKKQSKLTEADYDFLIDSWNLAKKETIIEKEYEKKVKPLIESEPIWTEWLSRINGIGIRNACRLLKYFGYCENFETIGKIWKYSGLHVNADGKAEKRKKDEKLSYNLKIKTGVVGVIATSLMLVSGSKSGSVYVERIYKPYKQKIKERGCCKEQHKGMDGHAEKMARRYMMKMFLSHYWHMTRTLKGLRTEQPYAIAHLPKHTHFIPPLVDKIKEEKII